MGLFDCFKKKKPPEPQPEPTPTPTTPPITAYFGAMDGLFGYFGTQPGSVIETADHCNLVFTVGWGDWSTYAGRQAFMQVVVDDLQTAKANGVKSAIVTVDFLVYTRDWGMRSPASAEVELRDFFNRLRVGGVLSMVKAIYPIDEPDLVGIIGETIGAVNQLIRRVANDYMELANVKLAVIYTDHLNDLRGVEFYDWVGFDAYGNGDSIFTNGQYDTLKSRLRADQRTILVPGGASPWRTDPQAFYDKAASDPQVVAIVPFIWFDNYGGSGQAGIRSNGMAPAYRRIGRAIRAGVAPV